jgi:hypothetical protein
VELEGHKVETEDDGTESVYSFRRPPRKTLTTLKFLKIQEFTGKNLKCAHYSCFELSKLSKLQMAKTFAAVFRDSILLRINEDGETRRCKKIEIFSERCVVDFTSFLTFA